MFFVSYTTPDGDCDYYSFDTEADARKEFDNWAGESWAAEADATIYIHQHPVTDGEIEAHNTLNDESGNYWSFYDHINDDECVELAKHNCKVPSRKFVVEVTYYNTVEVEAENACEAEKLVRKALTSVAADELEVFNATPV